MTRFTDGNKIIGVSIREKDGDNYGADFSSDFFGVGSLKYDYRADAYIVDDVDYLICYANDWANCSGDFCYDDAEPSTRIVNIFTF